jgi:hypothetical protein
MKYRKITEIKTAGRMIPVLAVLLLSACLISCGDSSAGNGNTEEQQLIIRLERNSVNPGQLIADLSEESSVILIAETRGFRENLLVLEYLVPVLHSRGITSMGIWFADDLYQDTLDRLLSDPDESESLADEIIRLSSPRWGYTEYRDFLLYVRNFNLSLPENEKPFTLIALGSRNGLSCSPDGIPEDEPAILFVPSVQIRSCLDNPVTVNGEQVSSTAAVLIHSPTVRDEKRPVLSLPYDGELEHAMEKTTDFFHYGAVSGETLRLLPDFPGDVYNGLIYYGPAYSYHALSPIEGFITRENINTVLHCYNGKTARWPKIRAMVKFNDRITGFSRSTARELKRLDR